MADLYLEKIGLAKPTIVERDNNGKIERLESIGLDITSLVAFWRRCFNLNGLLFEKIILHCKSKDFNAMGQRTLATCRSVREILAEQGVECIIDDEWPEKLKNIRIAELAEQLNESFTCNCCPIKNFCKSHYLSCSQVWQTWLKIAVKNDDRI
nr:MAG TPA: hypothetical protein [Caudoviricetes sp.]